MIDHTAKPGGAELALVRLCRHLDSREFQVRAVLFEEGPLIGLLDAAGVPVDVVHLDAAVRKRSRGDLGSVAALRASLDLPAFVVRLSRVVRELDPDVVHTTSLKADVLGGAAGRLAGRPVVWYLHDRIADDYLPRPVVRILRVLARHVPRRLIVNSRATSDTVGRRDAVVAYPGLEPSQVAALAPARAGTPLVGIVGRIGPTKGQLEFVRAAQRVLDAAPAARFVIAGAPLFGAEDYARAVEEEINVLGLSDRIELLGHVDAVSVLLDRLAVLVHASPVPEPFGQVVVEAMARSVPVVATDRGGVPEILRDGAELLGELVEPGDVDAIAAAVVRILGDPDGAAKRADRARESVVRRFSVAQTARVVERVWEDAARGR
ncbi:glycosyltransferase [Luteimicrobium subarcticum]|uniref:glycosyltransferase n=1 Tax=Luteimicrobium subarcticum TaxID=620910 RepID=UPI001475DB83|nr:glycosyltransferase [Luteimicrobium subarcticum]